MEGLTPHLSGAQALTPAPSIAHMEAPSSALGARPGASISAEAAPYYAQPSASPVETIQKEWLRNELERKHHIMGNVYGSHLPMSIKMEMQVLSQVQRLPGLPSSHLGLNTILGRDETISFEDYLGVPGMSEEEVDTRALLEQKYGLSQRSSFGPAVGKMLPSAGVPRPGVAMARVL